jgi:oligopeptide transport system substrate-binding protein
VYWKIGDKITSEKNPYYWNAKKTVIEKVNYFPVTDDNTEYQMYQAGQLDFTGFLPQQHIAEIRKNIPTEIQANPYLSTYYFSLNLSAAPFKDNLNLRKALNMVVDRNVIAKSILKRGELPAYDIVPVAASNYKIQNPDWSKWPTSKKIQEARKLYALSGYSAQKPLTITISYNTESMHKSVSVAMASMWTKAFRDMGLNVELRNQEWKVFLRTRVQGEFQVARDGWSADYDDVSTFLSLFDSKNPQNDPKYNNPAFDKLLVNASLELNPQKRAEIFQEASHMLQEDVPFIVLAEYVTRHLVKPYVGGYTGKNPQDYQYSREYYIKESPTKST